MKKVVAFLLAIVTACSIGAFATGCSDDAILVQTNAFFAPFEYYDGSEIVGVDVDIMERVGEKMGKEVKFQDGDFGIIIQTVSEGKTADVGAAGLTITDERKQYVDFSIPYYTSVQYVIWDESDTSFTTQTAADGTTEIVLWENLKGKKIGVQIDTTGNIYVAGEINKDEGFDGVLYDSGATVSTQENAQLAVEAMYGSLDLDCVVVDKLPAEYLVANTKNHQLKCAALYYDAETATEEQYAICVTPGKTELLDAINSVLEEMIENNEIDKLVQKHLGLTENN
mgnify:CR=1 FL=1